MDQAYADVIKNLSVYLNKTNQNFTSSEAVLYIDDLWMRYFNKLPLPPNIDNDTIYNSMLLLNEHYNFTVSMNITMRKLFLTGIFSEMVKVF